MTTQESKNINYTIFVVSNEPWGKQWFIKHHYANELAKLGNDVCFVDPVGAWVPNNLFRQGIEVSEISENLKLVKYNNLLPVRGLPNLALKVNDWLNAKKLNRLRNSKKLVIWQFDAFRFSFNFFNDARKIYHVADHYRDLPFDLENIKHADLIVCTSKTFVDYYSSFGKETIYIPHAISETEVETDAIVVGKLKKKYGDYILHAGSINDRLDISVFREILNHFENRKLVLIGPNRLKIRENKKIFDECISKNNCEYLGLVSGEKVKNYVKASKVCLVSYSFDSKQTLGPITSSLKVLNYLAQKKPVITSNRLEYPSLSDKAIFYGKDIKEYVTLIEKVLDNKLSVDRSLVDDFLMEHYYKSYIQQIFNGLEK